MAKKKIGNGRSSKSQAPSTTDEISYLRYYVAQLVRVWTALRIIRGEKSRELILVFQDLCSDKLRNMLHELANKRNWTVGFSAAGTRVNASNFPYLRGPDEDFREKLGVLSGQLAFAGNALLGRMALK